MDWLEISAKVVPLLGVIGGVIGFCVKVWNELKQAREGDLCVLRQLMLDIYYRHKDTKTIPEYEAKNFMLMYDAYKSRGGNSFIDEVHRHIREFELEV